MSFLSACGEEPPTRKEEFIAVKKVMVERMEAINNHDIEAYRKLFIPDYKDGGNDINMLVADMQAHFENYPDLTFSYIKNPMNYKMNTARMTQRISYNSSKLKKPIYHHESTIFRKVNGQWRISGGIAVGLF